jgi:hypothetical protein
MRTASLAFWGGGFVSISILRARHHRSTLYGVDYFSTLAKKLGSLFNPLLNSQSRIRSYIPRCSVAIPVAVKFFSWLAPFEMG